MSLTDKKRNIFQKLLTINMYPSDEAEDRISFKSGETIFLLQLSKSENDYYRILLPNFYRVDKNDENRILSIINDVNSRYRLLKVIYVNNSLWVSIESYFETEKNFFTKLNYFIEVSKTCALEILRLVKKGE
jgi:hypothetical protein